MLAFLVMLAFMLIDLGMNLLKKHNRRISADWTSKHTTEELRTLASAAEFTLDGSNLGHQMKIMEILGQVGRRDHRTKQVQIRSMLA